MTFHDPFSPSPILRNCFTTPYWIPGLCTFLSTLTVPLPGILAVAPTKEVGKMFGQTRKTLFADPTTKPDAATAAVPTPFDTPHDNEAKVINDGKLPHPLKAETAARKRTRDASGDVECDDDSILFSDRSRSNDHNSRSKEESHALTAEIGATSRAPVSPVATDEGPSGGVFKPLQFDFSWSPVGDGRHLALTVKKRPGASWAAHHTTFTSFSSTFGVVMFDVFHSIIHVKPLGRPVSGGLGFSSGALAADWSFRFGTVVSEIRQIAKRGVGIVLLVLPGDGNDAAFTPGAEPHGSQPLSLFKTTAQLQTLLVHVVNVLEIDVRVLIPTLDETSGKPTSSAAEVYQAAAQLYLPATTERISGHHQKENHNHGIVGSMVASDDLSTSSSSRSLPEAVDNNKAAPYYGWMCTTRTDIAAGFLAYMRSYKFQQQRLRRIDRCRQPHCVFGAAVIDGVMTSENVDERDANAERDAQRDLEEAKQAYVAALMGDTASPVRRASSGNRQREMSVELLSRLLALDDDNIGAMPRVVVIVADGESAYGAGKMVSDVVDMHSCGGRRLRWKTTCLGPRLKEIGVVVQRVAELLKAYYTSTFDAIRSEEDKCSTVPVVVVEGVVCSTRAQRQRLLSGLSELGYYSSSDERPDGGSTANLPLFPRKTFENNVAAETLAEKRKSNRFHLVGVFASDTGNDAMQTTEAQQQKKVSTSHGSSTPGLQTPCLHEGFQSVARIAPVPDS